MDKLWHMVLFMWAYVCASGLMFVNRFSSYFDVKLNSNHIYLNKLTVAWWHQMSSWICVMNGSWMACHIFNAKSQWNIDKNVIAFIEEKHLKMTSVKFWPFYHNVLKESKGIDLRVWFCTILNNSFHKQYFKMKSLEYLFVQALMQ